MRTGLPATSAETASRRGSGRFAARADPARLRARNSASASLFIFSTSPKVARIVRDPAPVSAWTASGLGASYGVTRLGLRATTSCRFSCVRRNPTIRRGSSSVKNTVLPWCGLTHSRRRRQPRPASSSPRLARRAVRRLCRSVMLSPSHAAERTALSSGRLIANLRPGAARCESRLRVARHFAYSSESTSPRGARPRAPRPGTRARRSRTSRLASLLVSLGRSRG